jgi:hypothetical protein
MMTTTMTRERLTWIEWVWRMFGAGPTDYEIDADLAEPLPTPEKIMSNSESELQLTPPPGTPDSPRVIRIFELCDGEWYAAETLAQAIACAGEAWNFSDQELDIWTEDAHELNDAAMERLMFWYDEDDRSKRHSFRTELDMRLADPAQKFPQFFAAHDQ